MDPAKILATGRFSPWVEPFVRAGFAVDGPLAGVLRLVPPQASAREVLLSVGVHGDETAPIALLAALLQELAAAPARLTCSLLMVVGNLPALAANKRFIESDLNRLFRTDLVPQGAEATRANLLCQLARGFFKAAGGDRIHLDLHSTIRPSIYPYFAVIPHASESFLARSMSAWAALGGMQAVVFSTLAAATFSAFTGRICGAASATLELGTRARPDVNASETEPFVRLREALAQLLSGREPGATALPRLKSYMAVREIPRRSEHFELGFATDTPNFHRFHKGAKIAQDGETIYLAEADGERILFPNQDVALGQRAGVVLRELPTADAS